MSRAARGGSCPAGRRGQSQREQRPFVVSHVWSLDSYPLELKYPETRGAYSQGELGALRAASGLLPFFAWVANTDHGDDTNLVVVVVDGRLRIRAIDFGFAFAWPTEDEVLPWAPEGLLNDFDRRLVEEQLTQIEKLTEDNVRACCDSAGLPDKADALVHRQALLRDSLKEFDWLD